MNYYFWDILFVYYFNPILIQSLQVLCHVLFSSIINDSNFSSALFNFFQLEHLLWSFFCIIYPIFDIQDKPIVADDVWFNHCLPPFFHVPCCQNIWGINILVYFIQQGMKNCSLCFFFCCSSASLSSSLFILFLFVQCESILVNMSTSLILSSLIRLKMNHGEKHTVLKSNNNRRNKNYH